MVNHIGLCLFAYFVLTGALAGWISYIRAIREIKKMGGSLDEDQAQHFALIAYAIFCGIGLAAWLAYAVWAARRGLPYFSFVDIATPMAGGLFIGLILAWWVPAILVQREERKQDGNS